MAWQKSRSWTPPFLQSEFVKNGGIDGPGLPPEHARLYEK
jgi:hypothetical protein